MRQSKSIVKPKTNNLLTNSFFNWFSSLLNYQSSFEFHKQLLNATIYFAYIKEKRNIDQFKLLFLELFLYHRNIQILVKCD